MFRLMLAAICRLARTHGTHRKWPEDGQNNWRGAAPVYLLPPYSQNGTVPSFCAKYGGLNEYLYSNRLCTPIALGFTLAATWFCVIIMQNIARNLQIVGSSNFDPVACIFHSLTAPLLLACSTNNMPRVAELPLENINTIQLSKVIDCNSVIKSARVWNIDIGPKIVRWKTFIWKV